MLRWFQWQGLGELETFIRVHFAQCINLSATENIAAHEYPTRAKALFHT